MSTQEISNNAKNTLSGHSQDVHQNVVIFNHISSSERDKSALKSVIEKQIASLNVSWELVPVS